jgi:hypothetical protein
VIITRSGGVDRNPGAARTGCASLTREAEQGSAGCYQRPCPKVRCVVRSPSRCGSLLNARPGRRRRRTAQRSIHDGQTAHPRHARTTSGALAGMGWGAPEPSDRMTTRATLIIGHSGPDNARRGVGAGQRSWGRAGASPYDKPGAWPVTDSDGRGA